jgi:hypothetical protein
MAYMKQRTNDCSYGSCTRTALYEVFNARNASCGIFCRYHASMKVKELERKEARPNAEA